MSAITNAARTLASADATFTSAVNQVAQAVASALGADPTYDEWDQGHTEFLEAYKTARGCTDKTAENRWSFVAKEMNDQFGLEKPRKPSAEGQRKAVKRAAESDKVDEAIRDLGTVEAMLKAFKTAEPDYAPILLKAVAKKRAEADKTSIAIAKETMKQQREELRKLIGKVQSVKGLEALIALAKKYAPAEAAAPQAEEAGAEGAASPAAAQTEGAEDAGLGLPPIDASALDEADEAGDVAGLLAMV